MNLQEIKEKFVSFLSAVEELTCTHTQTHTEAGVWIVCSTCRTRWAKGRFHTLLPVPIKNSILGQEMVQFLKELDAYEGEGSIGPIAFKEGDVLPEVSKGYHRRFYFLQDPTGFTLPDTFELSSKPRSNCAYIDIRKFDYEDQLEFEKWATSSPPAAEFFSLLPETDKLATYKKWVEKGKPKK